MDQYEKDYYDFQTQARGILDASSLRRRFEKLARWYDHRLARHLPDDTDAACFDGPCGYGNFLYFLSGRGYRNIVGYDLDPAQIELAKMLNMPAHEADVFEALKGGEQPYALISSLDFIEHLTKDQALAFLELCMERLQPGGCLILRTPCADGPFGSHDVWNDLTHQWGISSELLRAILAMKGFERIELLDERPQPSNLIEALRWLIFFPARWMANLVTILLGMSPPAIWSRSMMAVAYKPGEPAESPPTSRQADDGRDTKNVKRAQSSTASLGWGKRWLRNWAVAFLWPKPFGGLRQIPGYFRQYRRYKKLDALEKVSLRDLYPCLQDRFSATPFDPHYFYQGGWLARRMMSQLPEYHVDIGSSVLLMGVMSGIVKTYFVDYRPLHANLPGLVSVGANISRLPFADASIASLSSLHVIEHIGLGRYGDALDADGSRKAAAELKRILKPGGRLYLSVPIGKARVCFNAHRVFAPESIIDMFAGLNLLSFSYVDDQGHFYDERQPELAASNEYACGMYVFEKPRDGSD